MRPEEFNVISERIKEKIDLIKKCLKIIDSKTQKDSTVMNNTYKLRVEDIKQKYIRIPLYYVEKEYEIDADLEFLKELANELVIERDDKIIYIDKAREVQQEGKNEPNEMRRDQPEQSATPFKIKENVDTKNDREEGLPNDDLEAMVRIVQQAHRERAFRQSIYVPKDDRTRRTEEQQRKNSRQRSNSKKRTIRGKRTIKNKRLTGRILAVVLAGAIGISAGIGIHDHHQKQELDFQNRVNFTEDIIKKDEVENLNRYFGLDFSEEEFEQFKDTRSDIIYSALGMPDNAHLDQNELVDTAEDLQEIYQDVVQDKLENAYGVSIDQNSIEVSREKLLTDDGRDTGDYTGKGHVSKIGYHSFLNKRDLPKELRNAIIQAYGEDKIDDPITVDEILSLLQNEEIDKKGAYTELYKMLNEMEAFMTRSYVKDEKDFDKLTESDETQYSHYIERQQEQAKQEKEDDKER